MPGRRRQPPRRSPSGGTADPGTLRIIGGRFRGRRIRYSGDLRTRPMKDRVREAVFNLLGDVEGMEAVDLFAGTGALGLEALSRGARRARFIERHVPTAALLRDNIQALGVSDLALVVPGDAFAAARRASEWGTDPWLVFCSPPYDFYSDRLADMLTMLTGIQELAPPGSVFVVEADQRFDCQLLPRPESWDVRDYPPSQIAIGRLIRDA